MAFKWGSPALNHLVEDAGLLCKSKSKVRDGVAVILLYVNVDLV